MPPSKQTGTDRVPPIPGVITQAVIEEQPPVTAPLVAQCNDDANPANDVEMVTLDQGQDVVQLHR